MDNKLKFQGMSGLDVVSALAVGDKALIVTATGPKLAPTALLTAPSTPGGAGAGSVVTWDTTVTTADGFTIYPPNTPYAAPTKFTAPIIDNTNHSVTHAVLTGVQERSMFSIHGGLPRTGKYWFIVSIDFIDMNYDNYFDLMIGPDRDIENMDSSRGALFLEMAGTDVYTQTFGLDDHNTSQSPAVQKVLICLDIDTGTIDIYLASTLHKQYVIPVSTTGEPGLAGRVVAGNLWSYTSSQETVVFSTDSANWATAIPVGYSPLIMLTASFPVDPEGDYLIASVTAQAGLIGIDKGFTYYYSAEGVLLKLPYADDVALLNKPNVFAKQQTYQDLLHVHMWDLSAKSGSFFFGPGDNPLRGRMESYAVPQTVMIGTGFYNMTSGGDNFSIGTSFTNMTNGTGNVGLGRVFNHLQLGDYNVGMGFDVGYQTGRADNTVFLGRQTGGSRGYYHAGSIALGAYALGQFNDDPAWVAPYNTAIPTIVEQNVAIGYSAMSYGSPTGYNTAVGGLAMSQPSGVTRTGGQNSAFGYQSYYQRAGNGQRNTALGYWSMIESKGGDNNVAIGWESCRAVLGGNNIMIGTASGKNSTGTFTDVIGIGRNTLPGLGTITNAVAIGLDATVTGDNQVQLGNAATTTYAYGAVQSRSDQRDKADVRETVLGLEFIRRLRPVDYRWDMRDSYVDRTGLPQRPESIRAQPRAPEVIENKPGVDEEAKVKTIQLNLDATAVHELDLVDWVKEDRAYHLALKVYETDLNRWRERNQFSQLQPNGQHKRNRYHHGFIAQEVKHVADDLGLDFGGYQDHSRSGGEDVRSLGYEEFISPLVRAVQEIDLTVHSEEYADALVAKIMVKMSSPEVINMIAAAVLDKMTKR